MFSLNKSNEKRFGNLTPLYVLRKANETVENLYKYRYRVANHME